MPCYLRGTLKITDFQRMQTEATKLAVTLIKENNIIHIYKNGELIASDTEENIIRGANKYFINIVRNYTIKQVQISVQKKGWKVQNIKEESGKVIMRITE